MGSSDSISFISVSFFGAKLLGFPASLDEGQEHDDEPDYLYGHLHDAGDFIFSFIVTHGFSLSSTMARVVWLLVDWLVWLLRFRVVA